MSEHWQFIAHFVLNCLTSLTGALLMFAKIKWEDENTPTRFGWAGLYLIIASGVSWATWLWQIYHFSGTTP